LPSSFIQKPLWIVDMNRFMKKRKYDSDSGRMSCFNIDDLLSFHPQMVFLPNLCVNLHACLCGVVNYASAQALDFLDLGQKSSFLDWKHQMVPFIGNGLVWTGTT
jgi:hypothetical protein